MVFSPRSSKIWGRWVVRLVGVVVRRSLKVKCYICIRVCDYKDCILVLCSSFFQNILVLVRPFDFLKKEKVLFFELAFDCE